MADLPESRRLDDELPIVEFVEFVVVAVAVVFTIVVLVTGVAGVVLSARKTSLNLR